VIGFSRQDGAHHARGHAGVGASHGAAGGHALLVMSTSSRPAPYGIEIESLVAPQGGAKAP